MLINEKRAIISTSCFRGVGELMSCTGCSNKLIKYGKTKNGKQRYYCCHCLKSQVLKPCKPGYGNKFNKQNFSSWRWQQARAGAISFSYLYLVQNKVLNLSDSLPLTCSRAGTCCHGNFVRLNPWELMRLASAKKMSLQEFRNKHTRASGTVLLFNGKPNHTGKSSCSLYEDGLGCSVHPARPLACRLFPLGRQIQNGTAQYMHEGSAFPCLKECPEVMDLPKLTVEEYLSGQETAAFEQAQDAYMEIMQNLADISFELLLDTGLAESGDTETLASWREMGEMDTTALAKKMPAKWSDLLTIPNLEEQPGGLTTFIEAHNELLNSSIQQLTENLSTFEAVRETAKRMMASALFLAHAIGADTKGLSEHWIDIAKTHGAKE